MKNDLGQNINWLLILASIPAKQTFMKLGEEHGLSHMQLFTLCLISQDQEVAMQSISATLRCDASNTTGIIERLVAHGFIERSEYARDRRLKVVKLTTKGKTTRALIMKEFAKTPSYVLSHLTEDEIGTLKVLLAKALANCPLLRS